MKPDPAPTILILAEQTEGHRAAYLELFTRLFRAAGARLAVRPPRLSDAFRRAVLFSPMFEEHPARYAALAAVRSLIGRRSVSLLFRPAEAISGTTLRLRAKRLMLRLLRQSPHVRTLTILPFVLDPRFAAIAHGWIEDPQLWDLDPGAGADATASPLLERAKVAAAGRKLVVALGMQNAAKGFDYFARLWTGSPALRREVLFVAAGRVSPGSRAAAGQFVAAGGLLIDDRIDDRDLLAFHAHADAVWACYAPDYDQASGIFGRSVQLGTPVIVRDGALMHRLAELEGYAALPLAWDSDTGAQDLRAALPTLCRKQTGHAADARSHALAVLGEAVRLSLHWPEQAPPPQPGFSARRAGAPRCAPSPTG